MDEAAAPCPGTQPPCSQNAGPLVLEPCTSPPTLKGLPQAPALFAMLLCWCLNISPCAFSSETNLRADAGLGFFSSVQPFYASVKLYFTSEEHISHQ